MNCFYVTAHRMCHFSKYLTGNGCLDVSCLICKYLAAGTTSPVASGSFCHTGSCFCRGLCQFVTTLCNHLSCYCCFGCTVFIRKYFLTGLAGPVCIITIFGTGCCFRFRLCKLMAGCFDDLGFCSCFFFTSFICKCLTTSVTSPICIITCFGTGS